MWRTSLFILQLILFTFCFLPTIEVLAQRQFVKKFGVVKYDLKNWEINADRIIAHFETEEEANQFAKRMQKEENNWARYSYGVATAQPITFNDAVQRFAQYSYARDGYVNNKIEVANNGLGCSAFASLVLHQFTMGSNWNRSFDSLIHQKAGKDIAKHFDLTKSASIAASELNTPKSVIKLMEQEKIASNGVYFFDVWAGNKSGHVGFIKFQPDGSISQWHYSGMKQYNGLATGNFLNWLNQSRYRSQTLDLYRID